MQDYGVPTGGVPRPEKAPPGSFNVLTRGEPLPSPEYIPDPIEEKQIADTVKHSHYFKDVSKLNTIDVYRVLSLFNVTDPCIQHAAKKLLVAGGRGAGKSIDKDIQEAIDSLKRWQDMQKENNGTV